MRTLQDFDFRGRRALVRVDFNVPLDKKSLEVTDDTRLRATLPTIKHITGQGGSVVLMSHLGRPKGGPEDCYSLRHVVPTLEGLLGMPVKFVSDSIGPEARAAASALEPGQVLLIENLRFVPEEEKGDEGFAKALSELGDVWVNDAFGTAHRAHASTAVIGKFFKDRICGPVMQAELDNATRVLEAPERPYTAIMGGAKISDKILIIERLLDKVDHLIIGGAMAYTFFKAKGGQIGMSLVEEDRLKLASELMEKARAKGVEVHLPVDSRCAAEFSNEREGQVMPSDQIADNLMGLDIGPEAEQAYARVIADSRTVLWNGPMGVFEMSHFAHGTRAVADAVVEATGKGAYSLIGGGDSAAAVNQLGYAERVSYVSTGGGALLEYMEGKTLPGVAALQ